MTRASGTIRRRRHEAARWMAFALALGASACAAVGQMLGVQEPVFAVAPGRASTLRLEAPSITHPRGTATLRVWAQVTNPNAFGLTLSALDGRLALEGKDLMDVTLPLGLPLAAAADTVIPVDLTFGFESLSALGSLASSILTRDAIAYEIRGRLGVRAGALGEPTFGPRTWLRGSVQVQNPLRVVR